jgi:hypothetical protein
LQADLDFGGDDLATVSFTDGSTQEVAAGQGITFAAGGYFYPMESSAFSLRGTVGYKFVTTAADNADIGVSRVVLQLMGDYALTNDWHAGLGLVRHSGTKLDGDGFFDDVKFDDSTGFAVEVGWRWAALRYTDIKYTDELGFDWDASNVGVSFAFKF